MLTFFSLQSTNGMLFFAFADSFLIRTCLGILFCLSSHAFQLHKHLIFSDVIYTLSFPVNLQWFPSFLLWYYCQQYICGSLFSPSHETWGKWLCMPLVLLLRWVCVWAFIGLRFMMDWVCMARFASCGLFLVVSAGGVVGPVSHYVNCRNHILFKPSLSIQSIFGHFQIHLLDRILKMSFFCPSPDWL